jgi:zinc transporter, ZIP family
MSFAQTALLGALAGVTIYLGLPVARLQTLGTRARVALAMLAVGILAFIFVDVVEHGLTIVTDTVDGYRRGTDSLGHAAGMTAMLAAGFFAGSAGLALLERRMRGLGPRLPVAGGDAAAAALDETKALLLQAEEARRVALQRGLVIALAIGLHNFAEGLAIGVSARAGAISLATVLIIGFALHNATEGFGIVGPLGDVRPSWRWLGLAGLVGGGPTFIGTLVGYNITSKPLALGFYALAAGAILYVIGEVWQGMRRYGHRELGMYMLGCGFMLGVVTDLVVTYGGG